MNRQNPIYKVQIYHYVFNHTLNLNLLVKAKNLSDINPLKEIVNFSSDFDMTDLTHEITCHIKNRANIKCCYFRNERNKGEMILGIPGGGVVIGWSTMDFQWRKFIAFPKTKLMTMLHHKN